MPETRKRKPARAWTADGRALRSSAGQSRTDYDTRKRDDCKPVALAVKKRGRSCIVAKLVPVGGEPILAVCWRAQRGTNAAISMPQAVLEYAATHGARQFVLRDDRRRQAWVCPIDTFLRGRLGADGERYIPLSWLTPTGWREWPYATDILVLEPTPAPEPTGPRQLSLFEEVAA